MEELKQEALNVLMLAKEIQQETGASFENAMKAIELGEKVQAVSAFANAAKFAITEYERLKADEAARREKWEAEQAEERDAKFEALNKEPEGEPKVKLPRAKAQ